MDAKRTCCNLAKYVKVGANRWQYCPVVRGKTGRVKQDLVVVDGRSEHHPEGYYALDWREDGRRRRVAVGKDAGKAQQEQERHQVLLQARFVGLAVAAENPHAASPTVQEACEEFLAEIHLRRSPKTFQQYRTALAYFKDVCGSHRLIEVERRTLLDFRQFLAEEKKLSPRTIWTKMMVVIQMLKGKWHDRDPQAWRLAALCGTSSAGLHPRTTEELFCRLYGEGFHSLPVLPRIRLPRKARAAGGDYDPRCISCDNPQVSRQ
jgi:Phage integrase SAM-like domain